jgi:hypothetical protein
MGKEASIQSAEAVVVFLFIASSSIKTYTSEHVFTPYPSELHMKFTLRRMHFLSF